MSFHVVFKLPETSYETLSRLQHEDDHSQQFRVEVCKQWNMPPPTLCNMPWYLGKG